MIVPLLVLAVGLTQHQAHATSLAAVIPIAAVGSLTYLVADHSEPLIAFPLALGALAGAPLGARMMTALPEARLKLIFGLLLLGMGAYLLWP